GVKGCSERKQVQSPARFLCPGSIRLSQDRDGPPPREDSLPMKLSLRGSLLLLLALLAPASAAAQSVPYTSNGLVSITGGDPIYNGKYVIKQSDFGFFWLDTQALEPGHVQATGKCNGFSPPSDSGIYVLGDCNGITSVSSSGNVVLVRNFNGQCNAATNS